LIFFLFLHYITLHAEIYSARSYEEKIDRACIGIFRKKWLL